MELLNMDKQDNRGQKETYQMLTVITSLSLWRLNSFSLSQYSIFYNMLL